MEVVLGRTLVLPVALEGAMNPARPIAARLDDGRKVDVALFWIGVAPQPVEAGSWVLDPGKWTATPAAAGLRPAGTGTWALVAELPADAMGQGLWLGRQHTVLHWLPSPDFLKSKDGPVDWASPLGELAASPSLAKLSGPEARSPVRRWRHRLMLGGLAPRANPLLAAGAVKQAEAGSFSDPVIEAFAQQVECRWQVALATLWMADPYVAGLVKRRLANVVDFGGGVVAPAWPVKEPDLEALLADLLNARLQPAQQVDRARAWLDTQPPAAAWVVDDGGQRDAMTGQTVATIGAANLTERDTLGWTIAGANAPSADLLPIPGWTAVQLIASDGKDTGTQSLRPRGSPPVTAVEVSVGKWSTTRSVVLDITPAAPPGVRLEPFRREWDLNTWLGGAEGGVPPAVEDAWSAAGLLYFDAGDNAWNIFIECRSPAIGRDETVRVWVGAFGAPSAVLRISSSGAVVDEMGPRLGLDSAVKRSTVGRQGDTWTARVSIPSRCIEQNGTVRIGIERTDAMGRRTSWPRPMLPWQTEPGRIAVDTSAWGRLGSGLAGNGSTPASTTR